MQMQLEEGPDQFVNIIQMAIGFVYCDSFSQTIMYSVMPITPFQKKLRILPGVRLLLLNAPDDYRETLGKLPDDVLLEQDPHGTYDVVHLFVRSQAELAEWVQVAFDAFQPRGVLWISYPKKNGVITSDMTRDIGWEPVYTAGWKPVTQVSIDDNWSALRFRPRDEVGT